MNISPALRQAVRLLLSAMTSPPADGSGVQKPVYRFSFSGPFAKVASTKPTLLHLKRRCSATKSSISSSYLTTGRVKRRSNTAGDRPNVPKRLDSRELNSHKRGQTCAHSCPPTLPHPLHSSNLHLVTQHTIQGLLLVAWDELLDEWVAFYRGCPSLLSSAKGRDANDNINRSEHKLLLFLIGFF